MPSSVTSVGRKLSWADFAPVLTSPPNLPFQAVTRAGVVYQGGQVVNALPLSHTPVYKIADTLQVKILLDPTSFRLTSVTSMPMAAQAKLLRHEQGHYDIAALLGRDFLYEVLLLTEQYFSMVAEAREAFNDAIEDTIGEIDKVQGLYDQDTAHGMEQHEQTNWFCMIARAAELHRSPLRRAPNGKLLRIPLLDALTAGGAYP